MEELLSRYLAPLVLGLSPAVIFVIILLFFPEKIEKWSAMLWKLCSHFGRCARYFRKKYIKHDLQGRINDFVKRKLKGVPGVFDSKIEVTWIADDADPSSLFEDGKVIVRMRSNDPEDHNFVHATHLFVRETLIQRTKRYLSVPQRESIDLYVTSRLLQEEKPHVVGFFLDRYLHPQTNTTSERHGKLLDAFKEMDEASYFFPVFIQELEFIGDKVFGKRKDAQVSTEVNALVEFLQKVSGRTIGDESDLDFEQSLCRFAIVIVGKPAKLIASIQPYINFIQIKLVPRHFETIYLIARRDSRTKIDQICMELGSDYRVTQRAYCRSPLRYEDRREMVAQYIVVLRKRVPHLVESADIEANEI